MHMIDYVRMRKPLLVVSRVWLLLPITGSISSGKGTPHLLSDITPNSSGDDHASL